MDQPFVDLSGASDGEEEMLKLDGVTVEHNKHHVVDDLTLTVKNNEIFVFIGGTAIVEIFVSLCFH